MKYIVVVWDIRDTEATEPSSEVGVYYTLHEAEKALRKYLDGIHGPYIYRHLIEVSE